MSYNNQEINYKEEYRTTKRKLKTLIYENEFFQEELRKAQRSLLRVQRDKSFLLDRILLYQQGPESSSDSEETEDSDNETTKDSSAKRKRVPTEGSNSFPLSTNACGSSTGKGISSSKKKKTHSTSNSFATNHESTPKNFVKNTVPSSPHSNLITKKTQKFKGNQHYNVVPSSSGILSSHGINATLNSINDVPMSREEIERTLAARQPISDFPTTVSLTLPHQLFSDNLLEGDFIYNDIDGSPSNLDDDVSIDNYD